MANDEKRKKSGKASRLRDGEGYKGEGYEIAYWSQKVVASPEQLREALGAVEDFAKAVKDYKATLPEPREWPRPPRKE